MPLASFHRNYWVSIAKKLATPLLGNLNQGTLRANMPVEGFPDMDRHKCSHLEGFARLLAGIAPWLESSDPEASVFAEQARVALDAVTNPCSPDYLNFLPFKRGDGWDGQPLVDAAFLAQGILRAPKALWHSLDSKVKDNIIQAFRSTRVILPGPNNWLLFSAIIETALYVFGENDWDRMRIDYALRAHEMFYKGDGVYGDGREYHADYYNSFVIHPMLIDIVRHIDSSQVWSLNELSPKIWARSIRYAAILERQISPEGTYPPVGRSLVYRFGAFQTLSQMALLHKLPSEIHPAQVRCALTCVIQRMMEAPNTFDADGWLRIGFCGAQPESGESYISTGSLYLCSVALLPLGLPENDPFWSDPDESWTSAKAWSGLSFPREYAYAESSH